MTAEPRSERDVTPADGSRYGYWGRPVDPLPRTEYQIPPPPPPEVPRARRRARS